MANWKRMDAVSLVLLICAVLTVDVVRGENRYCCSFEDSTLCSWANVQGPIEFLWSGQQYPDLRRITDFQSHLSESIFLQDTTATPGIAETADFVSQTVYLTDGDVISVEFYIHQISADGSYPITLFFDDETGRSTIITLSKKAGWNQPLTGYCGGSNLCCLSYPCTGKLRVHGVLTDPGDLIAFDNVEINGCPVPTSEPPITTIHPTTPTHEPTTEEPTSEEPTSTTLAPTTEEPTTVAPTPPPGPSSFCCSFETGCPTWEIAGWTLSADSLPNWGNITPFTYDSQYAWNNGAVDAAKLISPEIFNVKSTSTFSLNYYIYNSQQDITNTIIVYFRETNATSVSYLGIVGDTNNQWETLNVTCGTRCCVTYPCQGALVIEASFGPGENLYAVDNIEVNDGCLDSPKCCQFDESDICGIINTDSAAIWKWSGASLPDTSYIPSFTSDGNFLWYQNFHVTSNTTGRATLRTGLMTVTKDSVFVGSFFVNNTDELYPLTVTFRRQADDVTTTLEFISDTFGVWHTVSMNCTSLHGGCCYPENKCDGYLEVSANLHSDNNGKRVVFYGVDEIDVDKECETVN